MNSLYTGGAEFSTLTFYGWMVRHGFQVKVLLLKDASPKFNPTLFGLDDFKVVQGGSLRNRVRSISATVRTFKPALVHSVLFDANLSVRLVRMLGRKFVHLESLVNEVYSDFRLQDPRVSRVKLNAYRLIDIVTQRLGTDFFHANGKSVALHYVNKVKVAKDKIQIVHRGRSPNMGLNESSLRTSVRASLNLSDEVVLVHVGRQEFQKAQDVLIGALAMVKTNARIHLLLVGREGNSTDRIRELIVEKGLQNKVTVLGHRDDVQNILVASDVFVFPSRFEGLPGVLIEAEAAGLPIVCSDIPNNLEVVDPSRNALIFPVDDPSELSNALSKIIDDASLRRRMGMESLVIFRKAFDLETVHLRMRSLIEEIVRTV